MSASQPEARSEYSRGSGAFRGSGAPSGPVAVGVLAAGLAGAILLLVAEFTPLLQVHSSLQRAPVATVGTGSHDSYALIPIGLLAAFFSLVVWRTRSRLALLGIGVVGLVAILIALLGDLPDAQSTGVVLHPFVLANATPSTGFYLETLGAMVLMLTAFAGLLLLAGPDRRPARPPQPTPSVREEM